MSEGDVEYVEEIVVQRRPADTVKSRSRKNARYQSDLLRRDGTIAGPTESRALNDSDIDALQRRPGTELPESDMAADQDLGIVGSFTRVLIEEFGEAIKEFLVSPEYEQERAQLWILTKRGLGKTMGKIRGLGKAPRRSIVAPAKGSPGEGIKRHQESDGTEQGPVATVSAEDYRTGLQQFVAAQMYADRLKLWLMEVNVDQEAMPPQIRDAAHAALEGADLGQDRLALLLEYLAPSAADLEPSVRPSLITKSIDQQADQAPSPVAKRPDMPEAEFKAAKLDLSSGRG